jgi:GTP pyrophosphokinase
MSSTTFKSQTLQALMLELSELSVTEQALEQIQDAVSFLEQLHSGQIRRSGEAYIEHPIRVATALAQWKYAPEVIIAGLLHDTIEDSEATLKDLEQRFGFEVALLVDTVTKQSTDNLIEKTLKILEVSPTGLVIKLADRLDNMRTLRHVPAEQQLRKSRETLSVYVPIARHLKMYAVAEELKTLAKEYY